MDGVVIIPLFNVSIEALQCLVNRGLVADDAGGKKQRSSQLTNKVALAFLELPANLLNSRCDELEVVLSQSLADVFAAREDTADIADVGEDLRPKIGGIKSAYISHVVCNKAFY